MKMKMKIPVFESQEQDQVPPELFEPETYKVEFSPFQSERIAVATAQYFGLVGNGRLHVLDRGNLPAGGVHEVRSFDTHAGLYDCAWSECHPRQIVTAGADGVVKLWDLETVDSFPVADWREHTQEVAGVDWNLVDKDKFASASWDGTVRVWSPGAKTSSRTFDDHTQASVHGAVWCPFNGFQLLSFSGDGTARVLDVNTPQPGVVLDAHGGHEVLAGDWDKYQCHLVATGCADGSVRTWDLRLPSRPLSIAVEHRYAVRRLRFSPFATGVFATASYDMTVVLWDANVGQNTNDIRAGGRLYFENDAGLREGTSGREEGRQRAVRHADGFTRGLGRPCAVLARCEGHTEFVAGVAFSLFEPGLLATCAWDRRLNFWW